MGAETQRLAAWVWHWQAPALNFPRAFITPYDTKNRSDNSDPTVHCRHPRGTPPACRERDGDGVPLAHRAHRRHRSRGTHYTSRSGCTVMAASVAFDASTADMTPPPSDARAVSKATAIAFAFPTSTAMASLRSWRGGYAPTDSTQTAQQHAGRQKAVSLPEHGAAV